MRNLFKLLIVILLFASCSKEVIEPESNKISFSLISVNNDSLPIDLDVYLYVRNNGEMYTYLFEKRLTGYSQVEETFYNVEIANKTNFEVDVTINPGNLGNSYLRIDAKVNSIVLKQDKTIIYFEDGKLIGG